MFQEHRGYIRAACGTVSLRDLPLLQNGEVKLSTSQQFLRNKSYLYNDSPASVRSLFLCEDNRKRNPNARLTNV